MAKRELKPNEVITGKVRLSYAHIWEPRADKKGRLRYGASLIIPKSDTKTIADIKAAVEVAYKDGGDILKTKGAANPPKLSVLKTPLRDGDAGLQIHANPAHAPDIVL